MRLRYTPDALAELTKVLGDVAEHSPQGAARVAARIQKAERTLVEHPSTGTLTTARRPPVRRIVVRPFRYILFYELYVDEVRIIGVHRDALLLVDRRSLGLL